VIIMAQSVLINGVTYSEVKEVRIPMASNPSEIIVYPNTDDADAVADSIKTGETAYVQGKKVTGTMPVNAAVGKTLDASTTTVQIPAGYTPGGEVSVQLEAKSATPAKSQQEITPTSGKVLSKVTVAAIPSQYITTTDATAAAEDIKKGETAYVNGTKVTGTHTDPSFTLANGVLSIV
jgi:hypothetical protein